MKKSLILLAGLAVAPALADEAKLASTHVAYPQDSAEFDGAGAAIVNNQCFACHSRDMITAQPKLSDKVWTAEVNKMRNVFKAPIDEKDIPAIVDFLVKAQAGL